MAIPDLYGSCTEPCRQAEELAGAFKAMGDMNRLRIIALLAADTTGTLGVGELATRLGITQPAVSQHLKVLRTEGIVESERVGFHVYFSFNRNRMNQIAGCFDQLRQSVLKRCDQQMVRDEQLHTMNIIFICYSYSGVTRAMMEKIHSICGGDFVEVHTQKKYRTFTVYTSGCLRSRQEEADLVTPGEIDVSPYDLLVIGTPVWAWKPSPAAHGMITGMTGCEGKKAVICATYSNNPGECLPILRTWLERRGVNVLGEAGFSKRESEDAWRQNEFIRMIIDACR